MAWTKRELVMAAFSELGLSDYAYNMQPQQLETAMVAMDSMCAGWETSGIYIEYPFPPTDQLEYDLDDDSTIDMRNNEAVYLNLAIRLAPSFGKTVQAETRNGAKVAYTRLLNRATISPELRNAGDDPSATANTKIEVT